MVLGRVNIHGGWALQIDDETLNSDTDTPDAEANGLLSADIPPLTPHASIWWYFLLLPRQTEGFGPRQMMFTFVSLTGKWYRINGIRHPGIGLQNGNPLKSAALSWVFDGRQQFENFLPDSGALQFSPDGSVSNWVEQANGPAYGGEIRTNAARPFGLSASFRNAYGQADFETWGQAGSEITMPAVFKTDTAVGSANMVSLRRLNFAGEFSHGGVTEHLEGYGYFQRVSLTLPLYPWKWMWVVFDDGSVISCFFPYAGLQLLRRGHYFLPTRLEQATVSLRKDGYVYFGSSGELIVLDNFEHASATFTGKNRELPQFRIEFRSSTGEFLEFNVVSYEGQRITVDRPFLNGLWHSRFHYNDYLIRIEGLKGYLNGRHIDKTTFGNGFGAFEYTWGLSLQG